MHEKHKFRVAYRRLQPDKKKGTVLIMAKSYWDGHGYSKEKSRPKFRILPILVIIILTMVGCFALYMLAANKSDAKDSGTIPAKSVENTSAVVTTPITTTTPPPETTPPPPANPVAENGMLDFSYFDSCGFVGDSITEGLSLYGILQEKNVFANKGMNIDKINTTTITTSAGEVTILEALKTAKPANIYIMLGSNGIAWLTNEKMTKEYNDFVDGIMAALPESKIYILSIPPVASAMENKGSGAILNSTIDAYNSELLKLANDKKINFVDINTALKGNDGKLSGESSAKDGMHFKKDTYTLMLDYILKHTVKE